MLAPASQATLRSSVLITADVNDAHGLALVEFHARPSGNVQEPIHVLTTPTNGMKQVMWDTLTGANGQYLVWVWALDRVGNVSISAGHTVTVDNDTTPPWVGFLTPEPWRHPQRDDIPYG